MRLSLNLAAALTGGALALISAGTALADPGIATRSANVRSGPGTNFSVVDTLRSGERIDVEGCRRGWCYVSKRGPDGWVLGRYIAQFSNRPNRPRVYFNFDFGGSPFENRYHRYDRGHGRGDWDGPRRGNDDRGGRGGRGDDDNGGRGGRGNDDNGGRNNGNWNNNNGQNGGSQNGGQTGGSQSGNTQGGSQSGNTGGSMQNPPAQQGGGNWQGGNGRGGDDNNDACRRGAPNWPACRVDGNDT